MATKTKTKTVHRYCGRPGCKQCWEEYKARRKDERRDLRSRGTVIPPRPNLPRGARRHDCAHTAKHHKASGRCRRGCGCLYAADKAARKG